MQRTGFDRPGQLRYRMDVAKTETDRPTPETPLSALAPYGSSTGALRGGFRDALGMPAFVLGASYLGFGSLVRESGFSLPMGLFSTLTGWALPGQVLLMEMLSLNSALFAICLAVALTNMRLLPMTVTMVPMLRSPGRPGWQYYLAATMVAVTAWVFTMRRAPSLPAQERMPYFVGFALTVWAASMIGTLAGFLLSASVPGVVSLGLVFLNPIYFLLMFAGDLANRAKVMAMIFGALAGPSLFYLDGDWSLLIAGLGGGTLAWLIDRMLKKRRPA